MIMTQQWPNTTKHGKYAGNYYKTAREFDLDESMGYLDTREFREHTAMVHSAILDGHTTVRALKDVLVDALIERYLFDSIEALMAIGIIERVREWPVSVYRAKDAPVPKPKVKYASTTIIRPPADKTLPLHDYGSHTI